MKYYCTSYFVRTIKTLTSKKIFKYNSCIKDIKAEFASKSLNQIIQTSYSLFPMENRKFSIMKIRIKNSDQKVGKRGGYRLIFLINEEKQFIAFLFLYPKTGRFGKENYDNPELKEFLNTFITEYEGNTLIPIDINNITLKYFKSL